ncbi:hypothetical protein ABIA85_008497 [Bradyrhizobium sp. LA6.10]|uniref:hypothetical protein n=1 Tax=Bradyrhizobium sp. LA6.10 TaxID=3156318 RepID=UPI0033916BB7
MSEETAYDNHDDQTMPDKVPWLSILGAWEPPVRRPGTGQIETHLRTAEFLMAPYECKSGRPATASSPDRVPLIMIDFPTIEQVKTEVLDEVRTKIETLAVNGRALRDDLHRAYIWLQLSLQYDSPNKLRRRYDHLVKIKTAAHRLRDLLDIRLDEWLAMGIQWVDVPPNPSLAKAKEGEDLEDRATRVLEARAEDLKTPRFRYQDLIVVLDDLISDAERLAGDGSPTALVEQSNPYENFLRGPLTTLYEKHIAMHEKPAAKGTRTAFVLFVQAAFKMMHAEYDLESIHRMIRDIKSGRYRRKSSSERGRIR